MSDQPTTIIKSRLSYFQQFSEDWWKEDGEMRLLHGNNRLLGSFMHDELTRHGYLTEGDNCLTKVRVLDVGCGGGFLSEILAKMGCEVTGIDVTSNLVEAAKIHASSDPLTSKTVYITESVEDHAKNNAEKYDVVVSNFVIEHVDDKEYFLNLCMQCVKPGGLFFVTAINKTFLSWLIIITLYKNLFKIIHADMHEWSQFTPVQYTRQIILKNNFEILDTRGYRHSLLSWKWSWSSIWGVAYVIEARKR
ncbi:ubiquinone biosynthesis O-methyltransferase, mitochondrial-like [Photinus pyralis]|uniref:Methyltransferase type 11 domain-containing protein n=2 Tax=Photinus pyralis TaxID=7054 RepID=A0A1Y1LQF4_PHOPY|nr:ubiquinone biosynthesis O-methyltransferase, mitochondrial-like [Photinus pyralis]XP_031337320.1 ubiquinone biosynthesis O-methyltransferase, mitochondrial-like [Photinus pyralis]XP_031337321.1 ubiquinone biosynthesis O-methyltransferase, mitochondrial-like [Photinus pyralis]